MLLGTTLRCRPRALRLPLSSLTTRTPICALPAHSALRAPLAATDRRSSGTANRPSSCPLRATVVVRPGVCLLAPHPLQFPRAGSLAPQRLRIASHAATLRAEGGGMAV
jgi:hypothetical protein